MFLFSSWSCERKMNNNSLMDVYIAKYFTKCQLTLIMQNDIAMNISVITRKAKIKIYLPNIRYCNIKYI